jgi:hypothetical protein
MLEVDVPATHLLFTMYPSIPYRYRVWGTTSPLDQQTSKVDSKAIRAPVGRQGVPRAAWSPPRVRITRAVKGGDDGAESVPLA